MFQVGRIFCNNLCSRYCVSYITNHFRFVLTSSACKLVDRKYLSIQSHTPVEVEQAPKSALTTRKLPLFDRIITKIPFLDVSRYRLKLSGYVLYESVENQIDYIEFFEKFNLPDTFYSWFAITELHVWMLMVRCMAEDEDGKLVRNSLIECFWEDVSERIKKIGGVNPAKGRKQLRHLAQQFRAAVIAYDEGLQSNDMVLAGALWRIMYQREDVDICDIEDLVNYVRKHIHYMESIPRARLFSSTQIHWNWLDDETEY